MLLVVNLVNMKGLKKAVKLLKPWQMGDQLIILSEFPNEYQHNRIYVFTNFCILVLLTKVASALEWLI